MIFAEKQLILRPKTRILSGSAFLCAGLGHPLFKRNETQKKSDEVKHMSIINEKPPKIAWLNENQLVFGCVWALSTPQPASILQAFEVRSFAWRMLLGSSARAEGVQPIKAKATWGARILSLLESLLLENDLLPSHFFLRSSFFLRPDKVA